jgi:AcrR family transcriptional regulator
MLSSVRSAPAFQRLPRPVRERQIVDAAVAVFAHRGYHLTTVDDVAEAAGISKPMVYAYVGTKEELFVACMRRESEKLVQAVTGAVEQGDGSDDRLWRGLRGFFQFVADHRDGWRVLYRQARGQETFAEELARLRTTMAGIVAGMLAQANADAGGNAAPGDVQMLAFALVGAAEATAEWVVEQEQGDPDETATRLVNVLWVGAGPLMRGQTWKPQAGEAQTGEPQTGEPTSRPDK